MDNNTPPQPPYQPPMPPVEQAPLSPAQEAVPQTPPYYPPTPQPAPLSSYSNQAVYGATPAASAPSVIRHSKKRTVWGILLILEPFILFPILLLVYIISNVVIPVTPPSTQAVFGTINPAQQAINMFLYLGGAIILLAWLPCIIAGIILLARKRSQQFHLSLYYC